MSVTRHFGWWLVLVSGLWVSAVSATQTITQPFLGVRLIHQTETSPRPLNINVVEIDLTAPGLSFMMTPVGPDPRPIGTNPGFAGLPMETIRQTPRQFANTVGAQIAINGSFYSAETINSVFWANNLGLTVSNGTKYSPWELASTADFDDALNITQTNQATIVKMASSVPTGYETLPTVPLYNAVTGSNRLLQSNNNVAPISCSHCAQDPHTAVGLTSGNAKLLLMTVDGRQAGFSEGLSLTELADWMKNYYGATNAINLDGGGSTQMAMNFYGDGQAAQVVNSYSDPSERTVGTNLAVFALPNGDYNQNGKVDGADYVVWRKSIGGQYAYDAWRQRFGSTAGSGSGFSEGASIPEPSVASLIAVALYAVAALRSPRGASRRC